jgi:hypothetical protein
MPNERYRNTQVSWPVIVVIVTANAAGAAVALAANVGIAALVLAITAGIIIPLAGWMTVTVNDAHLRIRFGAGLIRKQLALADIVSCEPTRSRWYQGTGVHRVRGGWLYNVARGDAVQLTLRGGARALVGTNEPELLLAALRDEGVGAAATTTTGAAGPGGIGGGGSGRRVSAAPDIRPLGVAGLVLALSIAFAGWYQSRQLEVFVTDAGLSVRSGFYAAKIPLSEITEVIVADSLPRIERRTNGFAFGASRRGRFFLESMGDAMLFVTLDSPPFIVIRSTSVTVILSFRDPDKARQLITDLSRRAAA